MHCPASGGDTNTPPQSFSCPFQTFACTYFNVVVCRDFPLRAQAPFLWQIFNWQAEVESRSWRWSWRNVSIENSITRRNTPPRREYTVKQTNLIYYCHSGVTSPLNLTLFLNGVRASITYRVSIPHPILDPVAPSFAISRPTYHPVSTSIISTPTDKLFFKGSHSLNRMDWRKVEPRSGASWLYCFG
jgi:hypothetical protein